ncbi:DUF2313 domain-containing protein [Halomonas sp. H33-56]|uniref:YmfQ family protein n=1 Tax=Halomonas sp. H33-56 TaxID=2950873 RepID=UPI0032DF1F14
MGMNADQYRDQMAALLPIGAAWPRELGSRLMRLLRSLAEEPARVDQRAVELLREADPRRALEMLDDWERNYGLPEVCSGIGEQTLQQRRDALVSKIVTTGGQSRGYFIGVAEALGYAITIEEFRPFRVGMNRVGDPLTNGDWQFTWRVRAPAVTVRAFRTGRSAVGEPLRQWGNAELECKLTRLQPSHTILQFAYGE